MSKFIVTMTRFTEEEASFVIDADHSDVVWDVVGNMSIHYLEDKLKWKVTKRQWPKVSNVVTIHNNISVTTKQLQNRFDTTLKSMEKKNDRSTTKK